MHIKGKKIGPISTLILLKINQNICYFNVYSCTCRERFFSPFFVEFFCLLHFSFFSLVFSRFPIARGIEQQRTRPKIVIYFGAIHNWSFVLSSVCISLVLTAQTSKLKIYISKISLRFPSFIHAENSLVKSPKDKNL